MICSLKVRRYMARSTMGILLMAGLTACDFLRSGVTCEDNRDCIIDDAGGAAGQDAGGTGGDGQGGTVVSSIGGHGGTSTTASGGSTNATGGVGGSGAGGAAGDGGSPTLPCDGACEGGTPVCDENADRCVECVQTSDCDEGVCDTC